MKCDIFISYRRDGGDMTAMYIYQALKERGYDVFYDLEVLRAGKFNDALLEYIGSCKDFVLILSPHSLDRCADENDWVRKEIAEALRLKKNIIPVMMNGFSFPKVLPDDISDVRYQNGLSSTTEYFMESVNRLCSKYLLSKPKRKKTAPLFALMAAMLILLSAAVVYLMLSRNTDSGVTAPDTQALSVIQEDTPVPTEVPTPEPTNAPTSVPTEAPTPKPAEAPIAMALWPRLRPENWDDEALLAQYPDLIIPVDDEWGERDFSACPVLGSSVYRREQIASITFTNTLAAANDTAWDVSEGQDGSVLAWVQPNGNLYDLFIGGKGGVRITDGNTLFAGYKNTQSITFGGYADFSTTDAMSHMFSGCSSLTAVDTENMDTSSVRWFHDMFYRCSSLTQLDLSSWDTSLARTMIRMFCRCVSLNSLDVSNLDTSMVSEMGGLFDHCESLTALDLSSFNTARVTDMGSMFCDTASLRSLDLSGFNTARVLEMSDMFAESGIRKLNISSFDTSSVTTMRGLFRNCNKLTEIDLSSFDTSSVTDMSYMFANCTSLMALDVSGFNTSHVTAMENMFGFCESLESLDLSGFDTSHVTNMAEMFRDCYSLTELDLSGFDTANVTEMTEIFAGDTALVEIHTDPQRFGGTLEDLTAVNPN